jgi:uridine kinase
VALLFKGVLEQYSRHVKPAFDVFIAPSMVHADIIVPRGGENEVAINLIVNHVQVGVGNQCDQICFQKATLCPGGIRSRDP